MNVNISNNVEDGYKTTTIVVKREVSDDTKVTLKLSTDTKSVYVDSTEEGQMQVQIENIIVNDDESDDESDDEEEVNDNDNEYVNVFNNTVENMDENQITSRFGTIQAAAGEGYLIVDSTPPASQKPGFFVKYARIVSLNYGEFYQNLRFPYVTFTRCENYVPDNDHETFQTLKEFFERLFQLQINADVTDTVDRFRMAQVFKDVLRDAPVIRNQNDMVEFVTTLNHAINNADGQINGFHPVQCGFFKQFIVKQ